MSIAQQKADECLPGTERLRAKRGMMEFTATMETFYILIWMVVTQKYTFVKLYTWNEYSLCKLYFSKTDFKQNKKKPKSLFKWIGGNKSYSLASESVSVILWILPILSFP